VGGAGCHPVAARLDGQCALFTPSPTRNPAPGELFRPVSWSCAGGLFALKAGSCGIGLPPFAHDGTERRIVRPQDPPQQAFR